MVGSGYIIFLPMKVLAVVGLILIFIELSPFYVTPNGQLIMIGIAAVLSVIALRFLFIGIPGVES